jgi:cell division protein ZapA
MAEVNLLIDGRTYEIACDDGQEHRVQQLGTYIDQRLKEVARGSGTANKAQLMVLTSLLLADEVFDLRDTMSQAANANTQVPQEVIYEGLTPQDEHVITSAISSLAARVEKLTARIQKT